MTRRPASPARGRPAGRAVPAAEPGPPGWIRPLLGLLAAVFVLKFIVVMQLRDHPLVQPDVGLDTTAYADLAKRVLAGDLGLGPGLYYVSPLYIYVLAAGLAVTKSYTAVRLLQIALGTASVGFIFLTAKLWFGERAAWIAAGLAGLTGLFTFYESLILQAAIDPFLTSAALLCVSLALTRDKHALWWFLAAGIVFGIQTLNRPNMPLGVAGIAGALLLMRRFKPATVLVAGMLIGMSPAAVRNVIVAHEWSFVSSHGGLNFYIGNSDTATGFFHQIPGITPSIAGQEKDAQRVAAQALGHPITEAEASDYFFGLAWTWIRQHPGAAIALFARKLGYVFNAQHIALPYSYPFYAYDAKTMLRFYVVGPWLLIPLGLVGLIFAAPPARRADYLAWLAFVPSYAVSVAAFFVAERYRLPILIPLCIGAGAAIDFAWRVLGQNQGSTLLVPGATFAVIAVLANLSHGLHDGRWEEGLRMAERLVIIGRYDEAEQWVQKLEPEAPRHGIVDYTVGVALLSANQAARAVDHLTRARELDPGQPKIDYVLGQALLKAGRAKEAIPYLQNGFDHHAAVPLLGYDLAVALQTTGDLQGAAAVVRKITPEDDADPEVWLRLGRLAAEVQAPDVALPFFQHAVQVRPDQASARQQLGLDLTVLGRYDEGARELTEAVRLDPKDPDSLAHLAYCEIKLGRLDDARTHVSAALAIKPDHVLARQLAAALGIRPPGL
ncbi:MAG TPA: tetratricopeptide repeat protein [Vicinamibacterales bacterium]|nr:tetratricopeptide repeat protein [Vicinamibacterales bacterium]